LSNLIRTFALALSLFPAFCLSQIYIPGYQKDISGEILKYHAPQPDADSSLLVRSEDENRFIEWESAPVPGASRQSSVVSRQSASDSLKSPSGDIGVTRNQSAVSSQQSEPETWNLEPVTLLMLAGIDVNAEDPQEWIMWVNDLPFFTIPTPLDTSTRTLTAPGPDGALLTFEASEVDRYGDFMGYLYVTLPANYLTPGQPVRFKVTGLSAGSRTWFMVFRYTAVDKVTLSSEQAVQRDGNGGFQVLRAEIVHYDEPVKALITIGGHKIKRKLAFGYNSLYLPVPRITEPASIRVSVEAGKKVLADRDFLIEPVAERTIYILHHSHNDIGYTHVQTEVERMQWENLDRALEISEKTSGYPEGAQLKWCTEVMWAVTSYYDSLSSGTKARFQEAVREGRIELNALFAGELTGLCGPEELDRLLDDGRRIARECGVEPSSAMITDIPGWSWAIVPALARSGVKYLSLGTNTGHRIGDIIEALGDKPFYWLSPSGREKVLCWVHGKGYSLFHTGLAYNSIDKRLREDLIFEYLHELNEKGYPYEEVMLRYNIGSDNGPVDELLPEAVKAWNEKYATPRVVISTVGEAFALFEEKHGDDIPELAGDITGYWEDGAYSTARETVMNRASAMRLGQAAALWAMYNPENYPEERFKEAWKNVLLFDEHTWGSWNSISEPESPFTMQQWEIKKQFALEADRQSKELLSDALINRPLGGPVVEGIEVINTLSWNPARVITLTGSPFSSPPLLLAPNGDTVQTQILSTGELAFIASNVPALGSAVYRITSPPSPPLQFGEGDSGGEAKNFCLTIDTVIGAIRSLKWRGRELVDTARYAGINQYLYVEGRFPDDPQPARVKNISVIDDGPVIKTIRIEMEAPGCNTIAADAQIIDELNTIRIINHINKKKVYDPEAVHIAFPFNIADGKMRYDLAYGYCEPEKDQLPGSNKNFLVMEHWVDISNDDHGVTLIGTEAPLFQVDSITMDEIVTGWRDSIPPSQTVLSYLMNNYWETNYAAAQEGEGNYSYIIKPHAGFDPVAAEKAALEARQPLVARWVGGFQKGKTSLIKINDNININNNDNINNKYNNNYNSIIITSIRPVDGGKGLIISLYNAGDKTETLNMEHGFREVYPTDVDGITRKPALEDYRIPSQGSLLLKLVK
jgi:hypothetical protein